MTEKIQKENLRNRTRKYTYLVPNFDDLMKKYIFSQRFDPYSFRTFMEDTDLSNSTLTAIVKLYREAYKAGNMEFSVMDQYVLKSLEDIRKEKNSLGKLVSSLEKMEKDD